MESFKNEVNPKDAQKSEVAQEIDKSTEFETKEHLIPQGMLARFHSLGSRTVSELSEAEIDYLVHGIKEDSTIN